MTSSRILAHGLIVASIVATLAAVSPAFFSTLDLKIYDRVLRTAKTNRPSGRVAIVAVDDRSLSEIGQWPWPRDVLAELVDRVRALGATAVALDMLLAEADRSDAARAGAHGAADAALPAALGRGRAVMSYALTFDADGASGDECELHSLGLAVLEDRGRHSAVEQLFQPSGVVCSLPTLTRAAGASGFLNAGPDRDGILRRIPLVMAFRGQVYPSLALAAVRLAERTQQITLAPLTGGRSEMMLDRVRVPLDERGTLLVRFRGKRGTYPMIAAADVLRGRTRAGALEGRLAFVGATALGVRDVVATPVDTALPGIEVHASAADTLLQRDFVYTPPYGRVFELAGTIVCGMLAAALVAMAGYVYGSALAALVVGMLWWGTFIGIESNGIFVSPLYPTLAALLTILSLTVARMRDEGRRALHEGKRRERAHRFAVQSLTSLMETRDGPTGQHARRTQEYSRLLAERLAALPRFRPYLTRERIDLISRLSPLHDIGKVGIRDAVLNKPGPLSGDELSEMRTHPLMGHETIERAERLAGLEGYDDAAITQVAKDIVYTHHERWDGRGYPQGLKGDDIPIPGRIIALVDVYDALRQSRSYRDSLSHEQAVETITLGRDTHFDPDVVDAFLDVQEDFRQVPLGSGGEEAAR